MTKYLLTCECGNSVAVDVGQAGGIVPCQCGKQLDVPPLRKLRHLPLAEQGAEVAVSQPWNARKGAIAVFLLLAVAAAISALIIRINEASVPAFDYDIRMFNVEKAIDTLTPALAWDIWITIHRPMAEHGFVEFPHEQKAAIEQLGAQQRFTQKLMWTIAAICSAIALAAALWPRPKPNPARPVSRDAQAGFAAEAEREAKS